MNKLIFFLSAILLIGCSDFLDEKPISNIGLVSFYETSEQFEQAVNGAYKTLHPVYIGEGGRGSVSSVTELRSDNATYMFNPVQQGWYELWNLDRFIAVSSNQAVRWTWNRTYEGIGTCNIFLHYSADADFENKDRYEAEIKFLRALYYFHLVKNFGDVPLVITKVESLEEAFSLNKRTPQNQVYEQIISDLNFAKQNLPKNYTGKNVGRATEGAARTLLAKVLMWQDKYSEAKDELEVVQKSGVYSLLDNYADVFKMETNFSSEYVYGWTGNEKDGSKLPGVMLENKGWGKYNGWGYFMPTKNLYDAFEPNDERRAVTILSPGDEFKFFGEERLYYSTQSSSGMQFNKYMDPFRPEDAQGTTVNPNGNYMTTRLIIPLIRFSEVLLWKAEALIWQGKNGDEPFNRVRTRAGLPAITNATKADLKHERRVELAAEFTNRHLDLVRWGDAKEAYSKVLYGYKTEGVTGGDDRDAILSKTEVVEVWAARNFDPSINHVFPIPPSVIDESQGVIKQNKGY